MTSILRKGAVGLAVATMLASGVACAEDFTSQYTSTKNCKKVRGSKPVNDGDWEVRSCPGAAGYVVVVSEDDLRTTLTVGRTIKAAENEPATAQGFGPFNSTGERIEWRSVKGAQRPFAVIARWLIADNEALDKNSRPTDVGLLVVIKLAPGPVCHAAYIDVKSNPEPNVLARKAADENARAFKCGDKPMVIGERGRAIELAVRPD